MDTKIVQRVQKLLALSESSNEHEARLAMLKAQEILVKHKLSLKEVKEFKMSNSAIKKKASTVSFTKARWKAQLASLIADNFGCYCYLKTRHTHFVIFFGREEDVTVCNIVLEYAVDCINSSVRKLRYKYSRLGHSTKGLENDYAMGFINGLNKAFEKQKRTNEKWALVLLKDKEVVDAYAEIEFTKTIDTNIKFRGFSDEYYQGIEDGKGFSISDKITNEESNEVLELEIANN